VVAIADETRTVGWAAAERRGREYLLGVYVHPRHRGVGSELLEKVYRAAQERWPKSKAIARPWSRAGEALYRGAGFEREAA
jgi:ribosomal protein S18 acetylase RimI-like enzyme